MSESACAKQVDSLKPSQPGWSFGTGSRAGQARLYISAEHSRKGATGEGPGPIYETPTLPPGARWGFGTSGLLERPKLRYPEPVNDLLVRVADPVNIRFTRPKTTVFGTAEREDRNLLSCAPGPTKYTPRTQVSSLITQSPRFTMTPRRPSKHAGAGVGPGTYKLTPFTDRQHESKQKNQPKFTFSQSKRVRIQAEKEASVSHNFSGSAVEMAFGKRSMQLKNSPRFGFGSSTRDHAAKMNIVRTSHDRAPVGTRVALPHPVLPPRAASIKYS